MSRLATGEHVVTIDGFTHGGEGVARVDGKAVFVPGSLPGEVVRLRIVEDRRRWARAELVAVVQPSEDRVEPPCPHADVCGGCDLQHVTPSAQLALKTRVVTEQLQRLGRIEDPPVSPARAVGPPLGYRTVARLHAAPDGRLGFHRTGTTEVVPIDVCPVLTDGTQAVRSAVGDETGAVGVTIRATSAGDRASVLHAGRAPVTLPTVPLVDGAPLGLQVAHPNGTRTTERGDGTMGEHVAGLDLRVDADGFFQGQVGGAEALVDEVLTVAGEVSGRVAWDLYAGVGLFTLPLARAGAMVTAVEGVASAADHLDANAAHAGLSDRVSAEAVDVRAFVHRDHAVRPDLVVLDPPRSGAGADVVADVARARPGDVVYVACDPAALARDARALIGQGYDLCSVQPYDLFPMTHHVEAVAHFRR